MPFIRVTFDSNGQAARSLYPRDKAFIVNDSGSAITIIDGANNFSLNNNAMASWTTEGILSFAGTATASFLFGWGDFDLDTIPGSTAVFRATGVIRVYDIAITPAPTILSATLWSVVIGAALGVIPFNYIQVTNLTPTPIDTIGFVENTQVGEAGISFHKMIVPPGFAVDTNGSATRIQVAEFDTMEHALATL